TLNDISCFNLLENCITFSGLCLDWHQICDGIMDCMNGVDEKQCKEMELYECDSKKEYRCRNGQCIPFQFSFDLTFDCLDFYDEKENQQLSIDCEEHICDLNTIYTNNRASLLVEHLFK